MHLSDTLFIGVDPTASRRPFAYAALDQGGRLILLAEGELDDVLAFAGGKGSAFVAINAPSRTNTGVVRKQEARAGLAPLRQPGRGVDMRLAEHELRERGISVGATPAHMDTAPTWMQLGFTVYARLSEMGYRPYPAESASRQLLETHPHATFCALLGQLPLPRHTLEGRIQRQLLLFEQGLGINDPMEFFDEVTRHGILKGDLPFSQIYDPGELDALAAACTARQAASSPSQVICLGVPEEGQIVLPVMELKARY
jgi:hypothetical protein